MSELVGAVLTRPSIEASRATDVLARHWGIDGVLRPLPSERDRNTAEVLYHTPANVSPAARP